MSSEENNKLKDGLVKKLSSPELTVNQREEKILKFWKENKIFEKTLEKESPRGEFVFYDGPPFATGLPHYGHLLGSTAKDLIPRYKTMRGYNVRRRWGWDCHGLPVENIVEKKLGLKHKKDIETLGIEKFNEECRSQVLTYVHDWKNYIDRLGRWVDFENSYKTMDSSYTESVWWALSQIDKKGMLYEGRKVLLYCPRCETPLSRAEIAMDNSYKDITEEAVMVEFKIKNPEKNNFPKDSYILAWTTTPWTLPANVALAVGPEIEYSFVKKDDKYFVVATALVEKIFGEGIKTEKKVFGENLKNVEYEPLYDLPAVKFTGKKAWYVTSADFVSTEDGTGIVHTAVIYGEDDYQLGLKNDLPMVPLLLSNGSFNNDAPEFIRGMYIKKAEKYIKEDLENKGLLFSKAPNTHSYPHCYRCETPLIYNALSSWFINIQKIKKEMIGLNEDINWVPEHLKHGRFLDIMENAPDWTISRNRFWASPLPIWKCENCKKTKVISSVEELKEYSTRSGNKYFVMRHGEADHNVKNIISSDKNNPHHLTENGKKQVAEEAKKLKDKKITLVFASPFLRTKETQEIVVENLNLKPDQIIFDDRLSEINLGEFNNQPLEKYRSFAPTCEERFDKKPQDGESLGDVKKRVGEFLYELESKYKNENILIITHEYPIWMMFSVCKGVGKDGSVAIRGFEEDFIDIGKSKELDFVPIPHNKDFELDLHRPYIDEIKFVCECGGEGQRIPEVIDCWVESGSMPFAEYNYPYSNKSEFEKRTPGDFVAEYIAQTRTWFYYMHAISTAIFGHKPFKNVVTTGTILASDGSKMSKSKNNFSDPLEIINKYGADALRYYLMTSVVMQAEDLNFKDDDVKEVYQRMINILRNVVSFYEIYKTDSVDLTEKKDLSKNILDTWILSRLKELHNQVTDSLDKYDTVRAGRPVRNFIEDLSTWYLRRSRDRLKSEDEKVKNEALYTTRFVLVELSKIIAPTMPFLAEEIYQSVKPKDSVLSVHLENWSDLENINENPGLVDEMKKVREIVTSALELRQKAGMKVRQPLASLSIPQKFSQELLDIIADEVNVKKVNVSEGGQVELDTNITEELKEEGIVRDIIRGIQDARKAEGLSPNEKITPVFFVDEKTKSIFDRNLETIKIPTGITEISFSNENQKHNISLVGGEMQITIPK